jgi:hypothetical protein
MAVPIGSESLVRDLFESVTMFDNEVVAATFTERADRTFLVRLELQVDKLRADGACAVRRASNPDRGLDRPCDLR